LNNPDASYFIQTWNTDSGLVIANYTNISQSCYITCEIEVTSSLFLIESGSTVSIYLMEADSVTIGAAILTEMKPAQWSNTSLLRYADISGSKFVYCDGSKLHFYTLGILQKLLFLPSNVSNMDISLTDVGFYLLVQNGMTFEISCVLCIYNSSIPSNSTLNSTYF